MLWCDLVQCGWSRDVMLCDVMSYDVMCCDVM